MFHTSTKTVRIMIAGLAAVVLLFLCAVLLPTPALAEAEGDFTYSVSNEQATITGYTGSGGDVAIPATLGGYPVTTIGDNAFKDCTSLTSVTIPNSAKEIGQYAFSGCSALTAIDTPYDVLNIGMYAFENCVSLKSAIFRGYTLGYNDHNDTKKCYAYSMLAGCSSLEYLHIEDVEFYAHVSQIYNYPNYYPLGYIFGIWKYPGSVACTQSYMLNDRAEYGERVFYFPESLKSISLGGFNYESYTRRATAYPFSGCTTIHEVVLDNTITSIPGMTFCGYTGLTSITIPDRVISIDDYVFRGCTGLTDVRYTGTEEQWKEITIGSENGPLESATIHYNYVPEQELPLPDFDGDGVISDKDAVYLLRHTLFPEKFPLSGNGDIDCDGYVSDRDAVYLLRHTLFPEKFPLYPNN